MVQESRCWINSNSLSWLGSLRNRPEVSEGTSQGEVSAQTFRQRSLSSLSRPEYRSRDLSVLFGKCVVCGDIPPV